MIKAADKHGLQRVMNGGGSMGMKQFPKIRMLDNGAKLWQHRFERFRVKVYAPKGHPLADIINFSFNAPYLLIFEERESTCEEAAAFAQERGFSEIASEYSTNVVFVYPNHPDGWAGADEQLFIELVAQSRIGPYFQDGVFRSRERFTKCACSSLTSAISAFPSALISPCTGSGSAAA